MSKVGSPDDQTRIGRPVSFCHRHSIRKASSADTRSSRKRPRQNSSFILVFVLRSAKAGSRLAFDQDDVKGRESNPHYLNQFDRTLNLWCWM